MYAVWCARAGILAMREGSCSRLFVAKGAESVGYGLDGMSVWQVPEARDEVGCQYVQPLMCTFSSTSLP